MQKNYHKKPNYISDVAYYGISILDIYAFYIIIYLLSVIYIIIYLYIYIFIILNLKKADWVEWSPGKVARK